MNLGTFEVYTPELAEDHPLYGVPGVVFCRNEAGEDWYDLMTEIGEVRSYTVVMVKDGTVISATNAPDTLFPAGATVYSFEDLSPEGLVGKLYDPLFGFSDPPPPPLPPHTPLEFMELWEPEERKAFRRLGKANEDVEDWLDLLRASTLVKASDPRTIAGINAMVVLGAITQERADEVKAQLRG